MHTSVGDGLRNTLYTCSYMKQGKYGPKQTQAQTMATLDLKLRIPPHVAQRFQGSMAHGAQGICLIN